MPPLSRTAKLTALGLGAAVLVYAVLVWHRRWIADDGLIVVRTVRQILEGNGPVYSPFERAEANTSTVWTWLLAAAAFVTRADVARLAVALGGLLAIGGFALALDAARRLQRALGAEPGRAQGEPDRHERLVTETVTGSDGPLVPAGALVVLAVFPCWDFATSGLEGGLAIAWIALAWWLLVTLPAPAEGARRRGPDLRLAIVVGLGPMVRPDLGLVSAVFLAAAWALARPRWPRALGLAAAAAAIPLAYEVFRAGFYGTLVPLPALAKGAAGSEWSRGWGYAWTFARAHLLYVPLAAVAAALVVDRRAVGAGARARILVGAPIAAGALFTVFLIRVGGDFMHGRLLVPPLVLVALPVFVLPVRRATAPVLGVLGAWALVTGLWAGHRHVRGDERAGCVKVCGVAHPTAAADHLAGAPHVTAVVASALAGPRPELVSEAGDRVPLAAARAAEAPIAVAVGRLGLGGAVTPLDGIVVDTFGLANPLGARITRTNAGHIGHEKELPWAWVLADFADPAVTMDVPPDVVAAARRALGCGELAELLASVRAPLTAGRFWANLTGAVRRTRLVIPADPREAERRFCAPP